MATAAPVADLVDTRGRPVTHAATIARTAPGLPALAPRGLPRLLARRERAQPPAVTGADLIDEIARSGLCGRGGGAFPTARKMRAVARGSGRPVVVANGTEGEPASRKDAVLMAHDPDLVIDGVLAAAGAVGAREAIIALPRGDGAVRARVEEAVRRRASGALPVRLSTAAVPGRFVAGEETALVHWLDGGPARPTSSPPRPSDSGVRGRPTLVQNVETMAHVALIARYGAEWFRRLGTPDEPGSMLATVGGAVRAAGVHEIAVGTPLGEVIERAGGAGGEVAGLLVGGFSGTWLGADAPLGTPFSAAGLRPLGAAPGAGALVVLPATCCGLVETARVVRYLSAESAGQCGPCVLGLRALAGASLALAGGRGAAEALREMRELPGEITGRGACAHPDGAVRLALSALAAFPHEVDLHLRGRCSAPGAPPLLPVPAPGEGWR